MQVGDDEMSVQGPGSKSVADKPCSREAKRAGKTVDDYPR
jgi:hypothetical protein